MGKAVVYPLLATVFIIFMFLSPKNQGDHSRLGLSRRLGYKFPAPNFDPLLTRLERAAEERGSSNAEEDSHIEDIPDAHEYLGDEGKLNITLRLMFLFPGLDNAPNDGFVTPLEMEAWNINQAMDRLSYRTHKEIELKDKNGDGDITFEEYLPQFSEEDIEKNEMGHGEAGWWKQRFMTADVDGNGSLSFDEFNTFLHPEDSNDGAMQRWVLTGKIKEMDGDEDGKLNYEEFSRHAYKIYREFEASGDDYVSTSDDKFSGLDLNNDKLLDEEELIPILHFLHPGELSYARYYSGYLIHEADDDGDGRLTLDEMMNNEYLFYSTIYDDSDEDYDHFHDEL
ncbi:calcium-binding EF hand family protein [Tripterygium wilfordii]|uniref:Calcium-binding EF hand family protein n=1 Tax=Tripterygium wilfordii TaxID=458696 RepID=A0A7J7CAV2_TRIWF|nr:reticulocalbin-2 [Tripterygium wilfordii]KAF5731278.1 calcium-binding EF hand family protein [Tripterygium wilfordii]